LALGWTGVVVGECVEGGGALIQRKIVDIGWREEIILDRRVMGEGDLDSDGSLILLFLW